MLGMEMLPPTRNESQFPSAASMWQRVVRYNQLSSIPRTLGNCVYMDEFNVEGNDITQLPVSLSVVVVAAAVVAVVLVVVAAAVAWSLCTHG